jgi:hypothetical protein
MRPRTQAQLFQQKRARPGTGIRGAAAGEEIGVGQAQDYVGDPHPGATQFEAQRLRERRQASLGRGVHRLPANTTLPATEPTSTTWPRCRASICGSSRTDSNAETRPTARNSSIRQVHPPGDGKYRTGKPVRVRHRGQVCWQRNRVGTGGHTLQAAEVAP